MKPMKFSSVPRGSFFKEIPSGAWHLKIDGSRGRYTRNGLTAQPAFGPDETVFVDGGRVRQAHS